MHALLEIICAGIVFFKFRAYTHRGASGHTLDTFFRRYLLGKYSGSDTTNNITVGPKRGLRNYRKTLELT